jgi:hypothetical protein
MALDAENDLIAGISKRPLDCSINISDIKTGLSEWKQSLFLFLMKIPMRSSYKNENKKFNGDAGRLFTSDC